jgi:DNA repair photolyase
MTRKDFDSGAASRPDFLAKLTADAKKYQALGITEQVMFSFTTDVYNPFNRSLTRPSIKILRDHGLAFCVLTKGGERALADLDLYRPDRDAFASTLTSLDEKVSLKWERGAAVPADRIATLKTFHERGIFTWVSLEPTLDCDTSIEIVRATHKFVDLYKIGRVNYLPMTKTTDWKDYTHRMIATLNELSAKHYIKRDLQKYLPPGYPNPLRVPQHH